MNKLIITALLMVGLVGMIGTASATPDGANSPTEVFMDINTDAPVGIVFEWYEVSTNTNMDEARFKIFEDSDGDGLIDDLDLDTVHGNDGDVTTEVSLSWNGTLPYSNAGNYAFDTTGGVYPLDSIDPGQPTSTETLYTQQIYIKDANNGATLNDRYIVVGSLGPSQQMTHLVVTNTDVIPIPEFPTVALPIAAILGLMFIISSRKKKE